MLGCLPVASKGRLPSSYLVTRPLDAQRAAPKRRRRQRRRLSENKLLGRAIGSRLRHAERCIRPYKHFAGVNRALLDPLKGLIGNAVLNRTVFLNIRGLDKGIEYVRSQHRITNHLWVKLPGLESLRIRFDNTSGFFFVYFVGQNREKPRRNHETRVFLSFSHDIPSFS